MDSPGRAKLVESSFQASGSHLVTGRKSLPADKAQGRESRAEKQTFAMTGIWIQPCLKTAIKSVLEFSATLVRLLFGLSQLLISVAF
jgi:hypothetical protein